MFRHRGKNRTHLHNIRLASILSLVAGIVNSTGVLAIKILTTNITGHFAFFSEELANRHYKMALVYLFFILSFLAGSFISSFLIEIVSRKRHPIAHALPMAIEILLLSVVGVSEGRPAPTNAMVQLIACTLLFAMGLQNALVTRISHAVVRTTHLTGLFTDLGIELSQLFFSNREVELKQLRKNIYLKLTIITCFFIGCLFGGLFYNSLQLKALLVAAVLLLVALFCDNIRLQYHRFRRNKTLMKR